MKMGCPRLNIPEATASSYVKNNVFFVDFRPGWRNVHSPDLGNHASFGTAALLDYECAAAS